jgi:hypothetical protein
MRQNLRVSWLVALGLSTGCWVGHAHGQFWQYLERTDTITMGAGNAKEVNSAIHTIDPWPPYVANRRIPGNGPRMTGAIQRYERPTQATPSPTIPGGLTPVPAYSPASASINPATSTGMPPPQ